jgi:hypothetical protein
LKRHCRSRPPEFDTNPAKPFCARIAAGYNNMRWPLRAIVRLGLKGLLLRPLAVLAAAHRAA